MVRKVKSSNEFIDILDRIGNGKFVSIGYVTGANLAVPTVKKKNPLTFNTYGVPFSEKIHCMYRSIVWSWKELCIHA